mgnify:CR=1 FL=1
MTGPERRLAAAGVYLGGAAATVVIVLHFVQDTLGLLTAVQAGVALVGFTGVGVVAARVASPHPPQGEGEPPPERKPPSQPGGPDAGGPASAQSRE